MKQIQYTADVCGGQSSSSARQLKRRIACTTPGLSRLKSCRRTPLVHRGAERQRTCTRNLRLAMVTAKMNMQVMVKLSVAASSGKLDLSNCNLTEVPPEVCNLKGLEVSTSCCEPYLLLRHMSRRLSCPQGLSFLLLPYSNVNIAPPSFGCHA